MEPFHLEPPAEIKVVLQRFTGVGNAQFVVKVGNDELFIVFHGLSNTQSKLDHYFKYNFSITCSFPSLNFSQMCCKFSCSFDRNYFYYSANPYIQNINKNFFVTVTTQMGLVNTMPDSYLILSLFAPSQNTYEKSLRIFFLMIDYCFTYHLF